MSEGPVIFTDGFTREQLIACAYRELRLRERVYPHQVELGRMTSRKSAEEIAMMRAVLGVLRQLPETPKAQESLFAEGRR